MTSPRQRVSCTTPLDVCTLRHKAKAIILVFAVLSSQASGQQMSEAQMQQMMQQQMGGGSAPATPNRVGQILSAAGAGSMAIAHAARDHPRTAAATAVAATTAVYVGVETRRSGLLLSRSPRVSLFKPSDKYLSQVLEAAADAPVSRPSRGVILVPLKDPDGQEESEEDATIAAAAEDVSNSGQKRTAVGRNGVSSSNKPRQLSSLPSSSSSRRISRYGYEKEEGEEQERRVPAGIEETLNKARAVEASGSYTEEAFHTGGQGKVKSVCAGVRVGRGLGLYHKFAQGLENLDVFDGRGDCELIAAESSSEGLGSTLGLLNRLPMGTWSLSPMRVALLRETTSPAGHAAGTTRGRNNNYTTIAAAAKRGKGSERVERGSRVSRRRGHGGERGGKKGSGRRKMHRSRREDEKQGEEEAGNEGEDEKLMHRQYSLALSAVEGAGWSGTWLFRVTYDAESDEVWFQTSLAQRRGPFETTLGSNQAGRVKRVNEDMLERGDKHAKVLRIRKEQYSRISSLSRSRAISKKELERDRILHPEKYKRVHRYMREDSHTVGGASARPARWGEDRRRNDIRLK